MAATFLFEKDGWEYYGGYIGGGSTSNGGYISQYNDKNGYYSYGDVYIYFKRQVSVNSTTGIATIDYFVGYNIPTIMNNRAWKVTAVGLEGEIMTYSSVTVSGTGREDINPGFVYEFWQDPNDSSNVYTPYVLQSRHIVTAPISSDGKVRVKFTPNFYYEYPYIDASGVQTTKSSTYTSIYTDVIEGLNLGTPPTITSTTFTELNTSVSNHMGNGVYLKNASRIRYNVAYTISAEVDLKYVRVTCGDQMITGATGIIENPTTGLISVQVVDSYDQSTTQNYTLDLKDYIAPTISISCTEPNALGETTLTISGEAYNEGDTNSWGNLNNTLTVRYAYRQKDDTEWNWFDNVTLTSRPISSHKYSYKADVTGLDYTEIYEFKAELSDSIQTIESGIVVAQVIPVFDWSKDDFSINVPATINGMTYGENVVLERNAHIVLNPYDGYANDWVALKTPLSKLPHGIVIVFGYKEDGVGLEHFQSFFVPKYLGQIDEDNGFLMQFTLHSRNGKFQIRGYNIYDDKIEASYIFPTLPMADSSMLLNGIDAFEIRYILGV